MRREFEEAAARARGRHTRGDSGIPVPLTSFVERNEVNELTALLGEHRLLTVTGSGGVGKTRIAIEVARRVEPLYDEAWYVDLLPVRDASLIVPHVAARLNAPLEGDDGLSEVTRRLRSGRSLLMIDNCEHLIAEAAVLVGDLLRSCPSVTVLITSREPLAVSGEWTYRLPSLDVSTATDLFVVRAQATDRAFASDAQVAAIIAEICKGLDGIPLAIELAASRVSTLGLEPLRKRLKGGLTLTGNRDVPLRHQTMEATIAWSYDLLSDVDRVLFQRLSVFFGSFTLEAAEQICSDDGLPPASIADSLIRLAQKSLINVELSATSTRYRFLDSIRAFAWNRLSESAQLEETMRRLISWFAEKAAPLESTSPPLLFGELRSELDNVAAAINWAQSAGHYPTIVSASRLLFGFQRVYAGTSRQIEMRILGLGLLTPLNESENPDVVGRLIFGISPFLAEDELLALSKRAIPLLMQTGDNARAASLHARCAYAECWRGDAAAAEKHLVSGEALLNSREQRRSRAAFTFAALGAYVRFLLKDFVGARALLDGLEIPPGDPCEVDVRVVLAEIEGGEQRVEKAIEILTDVKLRLHRYPYYRHHVVPVFGNLTTYYLRLGNAHAAEDEFREAACAAVEIRPLSHEISLGQQAAFFAAISGRVELAARLLGACEQRTSPGCLEDVSTTHDLAANAIRDRLDPERAEVLRRNGASEDVFELLQEFLDQPAR